MHEMLESGTRQIPIYGDLIDQNICITTVLDRTKLEHNHLKAILHYALSNSKMEKKKNNKLNISQGRKPPPINKTGEDSSNSKEIIKVEALGFFRLM